MNTSVQLGGAVMLAVISAIIGTGSGVTREQALLPHMTLAIAVIVGLTVIGLVGTLAVLALRPATRKEQGFEPAPEPSTVPVAVMRRECQPVACAGS